MKNKLFFIMIFVITTLLLTSLTASATIYRITNKEGNTIRVTTIPKMNIDEKKDGCSILSLGPKIESFKTNDIFWIKGIVFHDSNRNGEMDEGERGIPGISVSNGLTVSRTDEEGNYQIKHEGHFIFITVPSDYTATTDWYKNIGEDKHLFGLQYSPEKRSKQFIFVHITDHHVDSEEEHQKIIIKAIEEINQINPDFVIATGDMILRGNKVSIHLAKEWYDIYERIISLCKKPIYHALGNHDIVGIECKEDISDLPGYKKAMYRHYFGPTYYSFDWGIYHCIVLDPNDFVDEKAFYRISNDQVKWLKEDLSFRENSPLLVFFHEPSKTWQNQREILEIFKPYFTNMFSGHWHIDVLLDNQDIAEQVTGAVCGETWHGQCPDNRAPGYRIIEIDGKNISSYYKEIGKSRQINIIKPGPLVTHGEDISLIAQVYLSGDESLRKVSYRIDEGRTFPMNIKKEKIWSIATSLKNVNKMIEGYHKIKIEVFTNKGAFYREVEIKVCRDCIVPLNEINSHFSVYQGKMIEIRGKIFKSFMEEPFHSKRNAVVLIKGEEGKGVLMIADNFTFTDEELKKGHEIEAKVVPIRYSWEMLNRKQKQLCNFYFLFLPRGSIQRKCLKPQGIRLLWFMQNYEN